MLFHTPPRGCDGAGGGAAPDVAALDGRSSSESTSRNATALFDLTIPAAAPADAPDAPDGGGATRDGVGASVVTTTDVTVATVAVVVAVREVVEVAATVVDTAAERGPLPVPLLLAPAIADRFEPGGDGGSDGAGDCMGEPDGDGVTDGAAHAGTLSVPSPVVVLVVVTTTVAGTIEAGVLASTTIANEPSGPAGVDGRLPSANTTAIGAGRDTGSAGGTSDADTGAAVADATAAARIVPPVLTTAIDVPAGRAAGAAKCPSSMMSALSIFASLCNRNRNKANGERL